MEAAVAAAGAAAGEAAAKAAAAAEAASAAAAAAATAATAAAAAAAAATAATTAASTTTTTATPASGAGRRVGVMVHGGAWNMSGEEQAACVPGVRAAAAAAMGVLRCGGSAVSAVEAAVRVLEDNPLFDAGTGSVLNAAGGVEMDALLMDGRSLASGAVVGVNCVAHPITVARKVMADTAHAMLAGAGANAFAAACGEPVVEPASLVTPAAVAGWEAARAAGGGYAASVTSGFVRPGGGASAGHDTVGAVALDAAGDIAAGTSTGGITMKMVGRVGDTPLVGCGAYADSGAGGCSTTGHGESIIKVLLAHGAVARLAGGTPPEDAACDAIRHMRDRVGGYGGVILVAPDGRMGVAHSTSHMAWAAATCAVDHGAGGDAAVAMDAGCEAPVVSGAHAGINVGTPTCSLVTTPHNST